MANHIDIDTDKLPNARIEDDEIKDLGLFHRSIHMSDEQGKELMLYAAGKLHYKTHDIIILAGKIVEPLDREMKG